MERLPGVKRADVRLETSEARVLYDDARQAAEKLAAAIDKLGYQASVREVTAAPPPTLHVEGLQDTRAARRVEQALRQVKGVTDVIVDPGPGEVFVEYDRQAVQARDLVAALQTAGFRARLASP